MAKADHIVLCGGVPAPRRAEPDQIVRLDLGGDEPTIDLEIADISRRLSSDVPDVLTDLVEIASYVYCADQAVTRGNKDALTFPSPWRRHFIFYVPVRLPSIWSSRPVLDVLQKTLSILSEDTYEFHFVGRANAVLMQQYLKLGDAESTTQDLDEVVLFSGGVDSLGGTVQEAVLEKRRVALVSHRSNPKVFSRQKQLVEEIRAICKRNPPLHIPVWVHQRGIEAREYTQRSRTFLYASLAVTVARAFGLKRIRFYENGVVGLNLPISEQVLGARATRTTHPQVLSGFADLFSHLVEERFVVENPFLWLTKTEVVNLIGDAGCSHLIKQSVSCMHTHEQTRDHPHCGRCSQCISRRYATLASRFGDSDPGSLYTVDLLTGERLKNKDLTLVESFIRTATEIGSMNELQVGERYGEVSRVVRHVPPLSASQVADRIVRLYRRHSSDVTGVMDEAFRAHASEIRQGKLPATCAILLAIPESYRKSAVDESRESSAAPVASSTPTGCNGSPLHRTRSIEAPPEKGHSGAPLKQIDSVEVLNPGREGAPLEYDLCLNSDVPILEYTKQRPGKGGNGDGLLLDDRRLVNFEFAQDSKGHPTADVSGRLGGAVKDSTESDAEGTAAEHAELEPQGREMKLLSSRQNLDGEPERFDAAVIARQARAATVAKLIVELNTLKPQMFEDEKEYDLLCSRYPTFLTFHIAGERSDLKVKVLSIRASTRHIRLAQELAAAHHGRQLSTIKDDWKDCKPAKFRRPQ